MSVEWHTDKHWKACPAPLGRPAVFPWESQFAAGRWVHARWVVNSSVSQLHRYFLSFTQCAKYWAKRWNSDKILAFKPLYSHQRATQQISEPWVECCRKGICRVMEAERRGERPVQGQGRARVHSGKLQGVEKLSLMLTDMKPYSLIRNWFLETHLLRSLWNSWWLVMGPSHLENDAAPPSAHWACLLIPWCAAVIFKLLVSGPLYAPTPYWGLQRYLLYLKLKLRKFKSIF